MFDPEVSNQTINNVVFYLKTLKAPEPRPESNSILEGKQLFTTIGCSKCHRPEMKTGNSSIAAIGNKVFYHTATYCYMTWAQRLMMDIPEGSLSYEWRNYHYGVRTSKNSRWPVLFDT